MWLIALHYGGPVAPAKLIPLLCSGQHRDNAPGEIIMGYQNNERPDSPDELLTDVIMDLSDIIEDINRGKVVAEIIQSIKFIQETIRRARAVSRGQ